MISWSMVTVHMIPEIALQFFVEIDDGQQRPLISITTHFLGFTMFQISQSKKSLQYVSDYKIQTNRIFEKK